MSRRRIIPSIRRSTRKAAASASGVSGDLTSIIKLGLTINAGYLILNEIYIKLKNKTDFNYKVSIDEDDDLFSYWMTEIGSQIQVDDLREISYEVDWTGIERMRAAITSSLKGNAVVVEDTNSYGGESDCLPVTRGDNISLNDASHLVDSNVDSRFGKYQVIQAKPPRISSTYRVDGYDIDFTIGTEEEGSGKSSGLTATDNDTVRIMRFRTQLIFSCKSEAERNAIQKKSNDLVLDRQTVVARSEFFHPEGSYWARMRVHNVRSFKNVIIPQKQEDILIADVKNFLSQEKFYKERGIPYHRGYFFYGPPGTGKTSLAQALCQHFNLNLYLLPLSSVSSGNQLNSYLSSVKSNSVVVFEDFDVARATEARTKKKVKKKSEMDEDEYVKYEDSKGTLTLSDILNALDGIQTPSGLISIVTTNHKEHLDPALFRPGRLDIQLELSYVVEEQFKRMYEMFYGIEYSGTVYPDQIGKMTPADLMEVFKSNPYDAVAAVDALFFAEFKPIRVTYKDSCM